MKQSSSSAHFTALSSYNMETQFHFICGWRENQQLRIPIKPLPLLFNFNIQLVLPRDRYGASPVGIQDRNGDRQTALSAFIPLLTFPSAFILLVSENVLFFQKKKVAKTTPNDFMQIVPATLGTVHSHIHPLPVNRSVFLQGDPGRGCWGGSPSHRQRGRNTP